MKNLKFCYHLIEGHCGAKRLKSNEVLIFNVGGTYGNYQIKIGAAHKKDGSRPIEINGMVHHLFVNEKHVEPIPTQEEIRNNLKGTVIMNEVSIHLVDPKGAGNNVVIGRPRSYSARPRKYINLAGDDGKKMLNNFESNNKLANETYMIVKEDILKSIKA